MRSDEIKIFAGNSNKALAEAVSRCVEQPLGRSRVTRFSDGEIQVEIDESVRGQHTFVLQSTSPPANEHLMEMLIMIDALKRASADEITAVIPYYGYARQDRKAAPRAPITAKLVADLLSTAGATRVISMDLHAGQIQGFFDIPFDHLYAMPVALADMKVRFGLGTVEAGDEVVLVAPDAGGVERARAYAKRLHCSLAIIDKRRTGPNVAEVMNIIGEVATFGEAAGDSSTLGLPKRRLLAFDLAKSLMEAQQLRVVAEWARELKVHDVDVRRGEGREL